MRAPTTLSFAAAMLVASTVHGASTYYASPDASDMWWNADESGWGVNITQQNNILFVTLYVYAPDGKPKWYVASNVPCPGTPRDMVMYCSGPLYETTGPVGPGRPPAMRTVGDISLEYIRPETINVTYRVDGVVTSKRVTRLTWAVNNLAGQYAVSRSIRPYPNGCKPDVVTTESLGTMTISNFGSSISMQTSLASPPLACTFSGPLTQQGHFGKVSGNYSCSDGTSGPFTLTEIEASDHGIFANMTLTQRGCMMHGHLGGIRATVQQLPD